jgi:xanthosine utilization system XapX-like protein
LGLLAGRQWDFSGVVERIKAVQRAFWALLAVASCVIVLALPRGGDRDAFVVLEELTAFTSGFGRNALERTLLAHAEAQGTIGLDRVAGGVRGPGLPSVQATADAHPLAPRAQLSLGTLSQIHALTTPGATVPLAMANVEGLSRALGWRLSRQEERAFELSSLELSTQACSAAALAREPEIDAARVRSLETTSTLEAATKKHEQAELLHEQRRKWKASWKAILKANESRLEALGAKQAAQKAKTEADARYEQLVGEKLEGGSDAEREGCVLAVAKLRAKPSGRQLELSFPAAIELRPVPVPQLTGASFPVTHARGLWNELQALSPAAAIDNVRARFSWHYRYTELAGVKVGGMTVLQLLPLLLLPCLSQVRRRTRGVGATYNPFDVPPGATLPRVGLGNVLFNALALVVMPLVGCVLCAYSLLAVSQIPLLPLLAGLFGVMIGMQSLNAIGTLLDFREAIERSHSNPPPAPSAPQH